MRTLYRYGAYTTALIHFLYIPVSIYLFVASWGHGVVEAVLYSVSASGTVISRYLRLCPLTVIEKKLRRKYDPRWTFDDIWLRHYAKLAHRMFTRFIRQ
jgi:hypothetical protein